ncbi:MAG TPA: DUF2855 family protein [Euzebyales bacterium]|nr:DUF2855 family protein [Euzebyales bacterium]
MLTSADPEPTAHEIAFEVDRSDLERCRVVRSALPSIGDGQVVVTVERFAFTTNNLTYAVLGDELGYWRLFPSAPGWGRIPVWGHGVVTQSRHAQIAVDARIYGLLQMSTHVVMAPGDLRHGWFRDTSPHRADLSPVYNAYQVVPPAWDADRRDRQALLAPVFMLSFLLDALLAERHEFSAERVLVTSASSKAALGLAHLLQRRGVPVTGLTSTGSVGFVDGLSVFGAVVSYDDVDDLDDRTTTIVDIAGNQALANALSDALGDRLQQRVSAGFTHRTDAQHGTGDHGLATLFFAPDEVIARTRQWGRGEFQNRFAAAFDGFARWTTGWLRLVRAGGPAAVEAVYHRMRRGQVTPTDGVILSLHPTMPT